MMTPHTTSYYAASAPEPNRPSLQDDIIADVCVIGAGFTGISSALHLAEQGKRVVVLEGARVGWGASGRNGGQIVNSYSRDIDVIEKSYGKTTADALGNMAFEGGKIIRQRIEQYGIDCDYREGGVFAAITPKQLTGLREQKALWERYGNTGLELLDEKSIRNTVDTQRYVGGLLDHSGGHIHPLKLVQGQARALESLGGIIFEDSPVVRINRAEPVVVYTAHGKVTADALVVAGNAYLHDLVPELAIKAMPCGTQIIATEPLSDAQANALLPQGYCVEDCNYLLDYYRLTRDNRLLYGGGVNYGGGDPVSIEKKIRPKMLKTFPQLANVKVDFAWGGDFLLTMSRMPQLGRIGSNIYFAQGYSGHGVCSTHLAGKLIGEVIHHQQTRFDAFARLPHYFFPGGRLMRVPLTAIGAWYYDLRDKLGF